MLGKLFKKKKQIYQGEQKDYPYFYPEEIKKYYVLNKEKSSLFYLSDQTCYDLTFEDFFRFSDRTTSIPGQQYLYHQLRSVPETINPVAENETLIQTFSNDKELCEKTGKILAGLDSPDAYGIISLTGRTYEEPKGYILFRIMGFVPVLLAMFAYLFPSALICQERLHLSVP
ncbi:MAG: hypothetical protein LUE98_00495 [Tannerellaceae bacterium]|nr:hypothetical protein [Tannerellaceae bacterium]